MNVEEEGREGEGAAVRGRRRRKRTLFFALLALIFAALIVAWIARRPIATGFLDRELARRGVEASYEIADLGPSRQRIENLVIGDPADPDLTADWAEIRTRIRFGAPQIVGVALSGARLKGELVDGEVRFGQLDRLLPEPTGEPFVLPGLDLAVRDGRIRLATPYGPVAIALEGAGPLDDGFTGEMAALAPTLRLAGCRAERLRARFDVEIAARRPAVAGPVRAASVVCADGGLAIDAPRLAVDAVFSEGFDRWGGEAGLQFASLRQDGNRLADASGRIDFDGSPARTRGTVALEGEGFRLADLAAARAALDGHYRLTDGIERISLDGAVRLGDARLDRARYAGIARTLRGADGTPFGPAGERLAAALDNAARRFEGTAALAFAKVGDRAVLRLTDAALASRSGARLALEGGDGLRVEIPSGDWRIESALALAGGGFPDTAVSLRQARPGAPLEGEARIAPIVAGDARLELAPVSFRASGGGRTRIDTRLRVSGPLADGRVEGLELPVTGILGQRGALAFGAGCVPMSFRRLELASLSVGPTRLPLCPLSGGSLVRYSPRSGLDGGGRIAGLRLTARLGGAPLAVSAADFRLPLDRPRFAASDVAIRLGPEEALSTLDFARLEADFVSGGVTGEYAGGEGELYNVPIRLSESTGDWRFVGGVLDVDGDAALTSTSEPDPLFEPLFTDSLSLRLADNLITAKGAIVSPDELVEIARVDLRHDLATGIGDAELDTPRLEFNEKFRLADLTEILVGVVADVDGLVSGTGQIAWSPSGLTSGGTYQLTDVDMAASFGPVRGLDTTLEFTDLLGLNTEPNQLATVREMNPGVLVEDGAIRYQLLASNLVAVEGARWPFAGGEIVLEPTVLDFGEEEVRRMTFWMIGIDAWQFVQDRDFESLAATGIFDGVLPMVFDKDGGRIEGGYLQSREAGGTFSYQGEISDVDLGVFGSLAFNALELVRYDEMLLTFDGELDGEMITSVDFTGVTPRIQREGQNILVAGLTRQFAQIPVRFDITMRAPFQGMLYSVRLLDDPTFLVTEAIAQRRRQRETGAEQPVQAPESGNMR